MSQTSDSNDARSGANKGSEKLLDRFRTLIGWKQQGSTRETFAEVIEENTAESFSPQERTMLRNVLRLGEVRVVDVMVPRADIVRWKGPRRWLIF